MKEVASIAEQRDWVMIFVELFWLCFFIWMGFTYSGDLAGIWAGAGVCVFYNGRIKSDSPALAVKSAFLGFLTFFLIQISHELSTIQKTGLLPNINFQLMGWAVGTLICLSISFWLMKSSRINLQHDLEKQANQKTANN